MASDTPEASPQGEPTGADAGGAFVPPKWQKPAPLGYGQAIDTVTTIAAPLLAGFSVATIGVIASSSDKFRWPGVTLLMLTAAAILLVTSLQCGFFARQHLYSARDVGDWWPEEDRTPASNERLQREQHEDIQRWRRWVPRARYTYDVGIVTLALGVAAALVPPSDSGAQVDWRWAAASLAAAGAIGELVWIGAGPLKHLSRDK
jgi:hypothetical protein